MTEDIDVFDVPLWLLPLVWPVVVAFGGGLNSTALLVKWVMDGTTPPDRILFADTGNERPDVYEHIARFSAWLVSHGFPAIETTRKGGRPETLEQYATRLQMLPSMAYGKKGCSHKFKIEPQERDVNRWPVARAAWKRRDKVVKIIGYGFEEQARLAKAKLEDDKYFYRFPLNEWEVDREGCVDIITRAGLPVPGKSSCFFCPSMRLPEILALRENHPDLLERALQLEQLAWDSREVVHARIQRGKAAKALHKGRVHTPQALDPEVGPRGLGRRFAWRTFLAGVPVVEEKASPCMHCVDDNGQSANDCGIRRAA